MNRNERRRASRLHVHAGAIEVKFVGYARCEEVRIVTGVTEQPRANRAQDLFVGHEIVGEVFARA